MSIILTIFALIVSLNTTIYPQNTTATCNAIITSMHAYASIVEPVRGVPIDYTPTLVLNLNKPLGTSMLSAIALVPKIGQRIPIRVEHPNPYTFALHAVMAVPLSLSTYYKIKIVEDNITCTFLVKIKPPITVTKSIRIINSTKARTTPSITIPGLSDYDPLKLLNANTSIASEPGKVQEPLQATVSNNNSTMTHNRVVRKALLAIATGFLAAGLLMLILDRVLSRQSTR